MIGALRSFFAEIVPRWKRWKDEAAVAVSVAMPTTRTQNASLEPGKSGLSHTICKIANTGFMLPGTMPAIK